MTAHFDQLDDDQLWVLSEGDIALPILVKPGILAKDKSAACMVTYAMPLSQVQCDWIAARLEYLTILRHSFYWLIRPTILETVANKAPGITPKFYVRWTENGHHKKPAAPAPAPLEAPPEANRQDVETAADMDRFITYIAAQTGIVNTTTLKIHYLAICSCAFNWMIHEGRSLNLSFAKLHAVPYRVNWLQVLLAFFPGSLRMAKLTRAEAIAESQLTSLPSALTSARLIGTPDGETFTWTLHCQTAPSWQKNIDEYEQAALKKLGGVRYLQRWIALVKRHYGRLLDIYLTFVQQAAAPMGDVDQRLPEVRRSLRWLRAKGRIRPSIPPVPATMFGTDMESADDDEGPAPPDLESTPADVQTLPDADI